MGGCCGKSKDQKKQRSELYKAEEKEEFNRENEKDISQEEEEEQSESQEVKGSSEDAQNHMNKKNQGLQLNILPVAMGVENQNANMNGNQNSVHKSSVMDSKLLQSRDIRSPQQRSRDKEPSSVSDGKDKGQSKKPRSMKELVLKKIKLKFLLEQELFYADFEIQYRQNVFMLSSVSCISQHSIQKYLAGIPNPKDFSHKQRDFEGLERDQPVQIFYDNRLQGYYSEQKMRIFHEKEIQSEEVFSVNITNSSGATSLNYNQYHFLLFTENTNIQQRLDKELMLETYQFEDTQDSKFLNILFYASISKQYQFSEVGVYAIQLIVILTGSKPTFERVDQQTVLIFYDNFKFKLDEVFQFYSSGKNRNRLNVEQLSYLCFSITNVVLNLLGDKISLYSFKLEKEQILIDILEDHSLQLMINPTGSCYFRDFEKEKQNQLQEELVTSPQQETQGKMDFKQDDAKNQEIQSPSQQPQQVNQLNYQNLARGQFFESIKSILHMVAHLLLDFIDIQGRNGSQDSLEMRMAAFASFNIDPDKFINDIIDALYQIEIKDEDERKEQFDQLDKILKRYEMKEKERKGDKSNKKNQLFVDFINNWKENTKNSQVSLDSDSYIPKYEDTKSLIGMARTYYQMGAYNQAQKFIDKIFQIPDLADMSMDTLNQEMRLATHIKYHQLKDHFLNPFSTQESSMRNRDAESLIQEICQFLRQPDLTIKDEKSFINNSKRSDRDNSNLEKSGIVISGMENLRDSPIYDEIAILRVKIKSYGIKSWITGQDKISDKFTIQDFIIVPDLLYKIGRADLALDFLQEVSQGFIKFSKSEKREQDQSQKFVPTYETYIIRAFTTLSKMYYKLGLTSQSLKQIEQILEFLRSNIAKGDEKQRQQQRIVTIPLMLYGWRLCTRLLIKNNSQLFQIQCQLALQRFFNEDHPLKAQMSEMLFKKQMKDNDFVAAQRNLDDSLFFTLRYYKFTQKNIYKILSVFLKDAQDKEESILSAVEQSAECLNNIERIQREIKVKNKQIEKRHQEELQKLDEHKKPEESQKNNQDQRRFQEMSAYEEIERMTRDLQKLNDNEHYITFLYDLGVAYQQLQKYVKALYYLNQGLQKAKACLHFKDRAFFKAQVKTAVQKVCQEITMLKVGMGVSQNIDIEKVDHMKYQKQKDSRNTYIILGKLQLAKQSYDTALQFFRKFLDNFTGEKDNETFLDVEVYSAQCYVKLEKFQDALRVIHKANCASGQIYAPISKQDQIVFLRERMVELRIINEKQVAKEWNNLKLHVASFADKINPDIQKSVLDLEKIVVQYLAQKCKLSNETREQVIKRAKQKFQDINTVGALQNDQKEIGEKSKMRFLQNQDDLWRDQIEMEDRKSTTCLLNMRKKVDFYQSDYIKLVEKVSFDNKDINISFKQESQEKEGKKQREPQ